MKKTLAMVVALVLVFSLMLPISAAAAGDTYMISMQLSGKNAAGIMTTTEQRISAGYVADTAKLSTELFLLYASGFDYLDSLYHGTGLGGVVEEGEIRYAGTDAEWENYVKVTLNAQCSVAGAVDVLANKNSAVADLAALGTSFAIEYTSNAPASLGNVYTVTLTLTKYVPSPGPTPTTTRYPVNVIADEIRPGVTDKGDEITVGFVTGGGKIESDKASAALNETVTITSTPEDGKMINYVVVRDQNGNKVPLVYSGNGSFSFKMPDGGVTVTTTFRKEPADPSVTGVAGMLDCDNHVAFMVGDDRGRFCPYDNISRAQVCMVFYRLLKNQNVPITVTFTDVPEGLWFTEAVNTLASLGIIKGIGGGLFDPYRAITRAEFAAICSRFATSILTVEQAGGAGFPDVGSHWAVNEIATAAYYGWIYGLQDGTFAPNDPISREQAAAVVNRMLYRLGDQIAIDDGHIREFPDVNDKMWSWYEINEATYTHDHSEEETFTHEFWEDVAGN